MAETNISNKKITIIKHLTDNTLNYRPRPAISHRLKLNNRTSSNISDHYFYLKILQSDDLEKLKLIFIEYLLENLKISELELNRSIQDQFNYIINNNFYALKMNQDYLINFNRNNKNINENKENININRKKSVIDIIKSKLKVKKQRKLCNLLNLSILQNVFNAEFNILIKNCENYSKNVLNDTFFNFNTILSENSYTKVQNLLTDPTADKQFLKQSDKFAEYYNITEILNKQFQNIEADQTKINTNTALINSTNCIQCKLNKRNTIFEPCNHFLYCNECFEVTNITQCIICKISVNSTYLAQLD